MGSEGQLSYEGSRLLSEVESRGLALMDHRISPEQLDRLIGAYTIFTSSFPDPEYATMDAMLPVLPEEKLKKSLDVLDRSQDTQAEWHKYRTNVPWVAKPGGYTNRTYQNAAVLATRGIDLDEDPKEYYHYAPGNPQVAQEQHEQNGWGPVPREVLDLQAAFYDIHALARELTFETLGIIEETHPDIRNYFTPKSILNSPLRLLFYHYTENSILGGGHYDKAGLTFQIAESHEGLEVAPPNKPLEAVRRPGNKAAFFPGQKIEEIHPDTPYKAAWHDIVSSDVLNEGRNMPPETALICARWALIFFANRKDFRQPNKARTHTRVDVVV